MSARITLGTALLLMILASCSCTVWKQPRNPSWKSATGGEQYERLLWQAIRDSDWKEVEAHLAPMFAGVGPAGEKLDRAAFLDYWKAAKVREFSLGELTVQPNGADIVVSYELRLQSASGRAVSARGLRVISVWQQLKRGWVLTAQSATPIV